MHIQAGFQGFMGPTPYGDCSHLSISGQMLPDIGKRRHQTDTDGVHLQNWAELMLRAIFCSIHHTMTWGSFNNQVDKKEAGRWSMNP